MLEEAAINLVALWHSQKIEGLPRAERNVAIEGQRRRLTQAVRALTGKVRDDVRAKTVSAALSPLAKGMGDV